MKNLFILLITLLIAMLPAAVTGTTDTAEFTGTVSDIAESSFLLTTEEDTIQVNATAEQLAGLTDGMTVTVTCDGTMTLSLPAQISAMKIVEVPPTITGTVVEAYVLIETADGQTIQVNLSSDTVLPSVFPDSGDTVTVTYDGQMTRSIPAQINADRLETVENND